MQELSAETDSVASSRQSLPTSGCVDFA